MLTRIEEEAVVKGRPEDRTRTRTGPVSSIPATVASPALFLVPANPLRSPLYITEIRGLLFNWPMRTISFARERNLFSIFVINCTPC
jgi:hypothetical protein